VPTVFCFVHSINDKVWRPLSMREGRSGDYFSQLAKLFGDSTNVLVSDHRSEFEAGA